MHECRIGETVLHYAVLSLKRDLVDMLLDLDVDPRYPNSASLAKDSSPVLAHPFLRKGSSSNGTAIDVARATGQAEVLALLESAYLFTPLNGPL